MWKPKKVVWDHGTVSAFSLRSHGVTSLDVTACSREATSQAPLCDHESVHPTALRLYGRVGNRSMVIGFESEEQLREWEELAESHFATV